MNDSSPPSDSSISSRARIGLVVPAGNLMDREYWALADGVAEIFISRTDHLDGGMVRGRSRGLADPELVAPAVRQLLAVRPHVVVFACTAGSFIGGSSGESALRSMILDSGAPRALTTSGALVQVLQRLGLRRLAVATPYTDLLTDDLTRFLTESGIEVVSTSALGLLDPDEVGDLDMPVLERMVESADSPDAEAVFLSCTNLPTVGRLGPLSARIGKPVLSSNLVTMVAALHAAGLGDRADELVPGGV